MSTLTLNPAISGSLLLLRQSLSTIYVPFSYPKIMLVMARSIGIAINDTSFTDEFGHWCGRLLKTIIESFRLSEFSKGPSELSIPTQMSSKVRHTG